MHRRQPPAQPATRTRPAAPPAAPDQLWTIAQTADFLQLPIATLYRWRSAGYGPPSHRIGRHIRYQPDEVERWVRRQP